MLKQFLIVFGVVLLVVGILGFFNNPVLGLFPVNGLHNVIHLLSGLLALIFAFQSESAAKQFCLVLGIVYALVFVLGLIAPAFMASLLVVNGADNVLHLILAVVFIALSRMSFSGKSMPMQS